MSEASGEVMKLFFPGIGAVLLAFSGSVLGQPPPSCQLVFDPGDPRLYQIIETRKLVNFADYDGLEIRHIQVVVLQIFNENDPAENNWLYRTVNYLHIDTRHRAIEKQLIVHPQTALDARVVQENERLLRDNPYLADAMIVPHQICGGQIDLLVVVRDIWTLIPTVSFARTGGENRSEVGISDNNILGTGRRASIEYNRNADRTGISIKYRNSELFGNHTRLRVTYQDNSDGELKSVDLARPFYQLDSSWSAGASIHDETRLEDIESGQQTINRFRHDIHQYEVFNGWSAGLIDNRVHRWSLGVTDQEDDFSVVDPASPPPPDDRRLLYPWLAFESIEDRYWTTTNISQIFRHEDILLGTRWAVRAGYADEDFGSTENAAIFNFNNLYTNSFGEHHLFQASASTDGRVNTSTGNLASSFFNLRFTYFHFLDEDDRLFANLRLAAAKNINQDEQLTSGGDENLRGYPDDTQRGNRRWLLTVERRYYLDLHLFRLFRFGAALYLDAGRTWDTETADAPSARTLANAGLGLRINPSKARSEKVLHIDIAAPLVDRSDIDSYQLLITGKSEF